MGKVIKWILIVLFILVSLFLIAILFISNEFGKSFPLKPIVLICLTDLDSSSLSIRNLVRFRDANPIYNVPYNIKALRPYRILDADHLQLSAYFNKTDSVVYFVSWQKKCSYLRYIYFPLKQDYISKSKLLEMNPDSTLYYQKEIDKANLFIQNEILPKLIVKTELINARD